MLFHINYLSLNHEGRVLFQNIVLCFLAVMHYCAQSFNLRLNNLFAFTFSLLSHSLFLFFRSLQQAMQTCAYIDVVASFFFGSSTFFIKLQGSLCSNLFATRFRHRDCTTAVLVLDPPPLYPPLLPFIRLFFNLSNLSAPYSIYTFFHLSAPYSIHTCFHLSAPY